MMRKSIVLLLVGLLAVALSSSVTVAEENEPVPVYILAYYEDDYTVDLSYQVPVVVNSWVACSKGQIRSFLKAIDVHEYALTRDGTEVWSLGTEEAQELWGPVQDTDFPFECFAPGLSPKVTYWWYVLDLGPGDYVLHSTASLAHPVIDGFDAWPEDGLPDLYSSGVQYDTVNTIHVQ